MDPTVTFALCVGAVLATGLLAGASLDQSVKQLPARHRLGAEAFSRYSRAADLDRGVPLYASLGVGVLVSCLAAAVATIIFRGTGLSRLLPAICTAVLALLHTVVTGRAAPLNFSQRKISLQDSAALASIFDRFARLQAIRCALQVANFAAALWLLVVS